MTVQNPTLEIDLAALCANYRRFAAACPNAEAAAVVKCDAYGLGAPAIGRALAEKENCRSFFVAYSEEGAALRGAIGGGPEIFVFNGPFAETLPAYREHRLTPVLNSLDQAQLWAGAMGGAPAAANFDTGMHRLGMPPTDIAALRTIAGLNVSVMMSHLACASDASHPMNERQHAAFAAIASSFPAARKSLSSSGGALLGAAFVFDLLRLGVGIYGVSPQDAGATGLAPVARLTAPVIQVRDIEGGESVGYGATFTSQSTLTLATVALGYGDGFPRAASNRAKAHLGGVLCPIVGRVSMDLIVLDATALRARPAPGARAEFFGPNLPIEDTANACGTIGYELLTGIGGLARPRRGLGGRVERRYLFAGAPADDRFSGAEGN